MFSYTVYCASAGFPLDDLQSWNTIQVDNQTVYTSIGTGGHVDEYCRFVGRTDDGRLHVLLAQDEPGGRSYDRLEETYLHLQQLYKDDLFITRMPMPAESFLEVDERDVTYYQLKSLRGITVDEKIWLMPAKSYMNYVIANGAILLPQYGEDTDALAKHVIQKIFPSYVVYQIDPLPVNYGGGGMNCITNNQPVCSNEQQTYYAPLTA